MKKSTLLLIILTTFFGYSQKKGNDPDVTNKSLEINSGKTISKIIELDKVVKGIGPGGNQMIGIASRDLMSEEELKAYPKMKNIPDSLTDVKEYLFIKNYLQFYYQNYKQGIYSKEYFIKKATSNKKNLSDTIHLSTEIIKNTISVVSGLTPDKSIVYIVDSNNNNDYSDDEQKTLISNLRKQDDIIENSQSVDIEYFDGNFIKKDTQLITVSKNSYDDGLLFRFPQYRYGKVKLGDENYLVLAESHSFNESIFFIKDQLNFGPVDRKNRINPSQYLEAGNNYIKYSVVSQNMDKIELTISANDPENKVVPVSNQVGMVAPDISGLNILNDLKISLKEFRGKYVFLDFWSSSCAPCFVEFPEINKAYDKFSKSEFQVIGIADIRGNIDAKEFAKDKNVTWPTIVEQNSSTINKGYTINTWPTSYLIDPTGKIIATNLRGKDLNNKLELLKVSAKN